MKIIQEASAIAGMIRIGLRPHDSVLVEIINALRTKIEQQNENIEDIVAFTLFLQPWMKEDETIESFTPEEITAFHKKWKMEWLPSLYDDHCGDCTDVCAPCTRCGTERYLKEAGHILRNIKG